MIDFLRSKLSQLIYSKSIEQDPFLLTQESERTDFELNEVINDPENHLVGVMYKFLNDSESKLHRHEYIEHIIVLEGEVEVNLADKNKIKIVKGGSFTLPPNISHYTKSIKGTIKLVIWHPKYDDKIQVQSIM